MNFLSKVWHVVRWPLLILAVAYVALVIWRIPGYKQEQRSAQAVAYIQSQHITLADVMGANVPPEPTSPDATVAGVDANHNGIRDDVELAIFKKYPNSSKIRAAELQYALALQLMLTQVSDTETWKAAAFQYSRADGCITDSNIKNEIDNIVLNTQLRKDAEESAFKFTTSLALPSKDFCDIDLNSLPN